MSSFWNLGAIVLGVSLLVASPVYAEDEPDTGGTEVTEASSDDDDIICRRIRTTGTRITRRYCMSRTEWTSLREESQEQIRESNQRGRVSTGGGDQ